MGNVLQKEDTSNLGDALDSASQNSHFPNHVQQLRQISNHEESIDVEIRDYVEMLNNLNGEQKKRVKNLLTRYRIFFSNQPGCTNVYNHPITLIKPKTIDESYIQSR